nr:DUF4229 domain-containing protein [Rothia sp. ZJ1223]
MKYTLLRFGIMVAVFMGCIWLNIALVFSAIFAILIALALCYLLFPTLHRKAGEDLARFFSRKKKRPTEEDLNRDIEDSYVDSLQENQRLP